MHREAVQLLEGGRQLLQQLPCGVRGAQEAAAVPLRPFHTLQKGFREAFRGDLKAISRRFQGDFKAIKLDFEAISHRVLLENPRSRMALLPITYRALGSTALRAGGALLEPANERAALAPCHGHAAELRAGLPRRQVPEPPQKKGL